MLTQSPNTYSQIYKKLSPASVVLLSTLQVHEGKHKLNIFELLSQKNSLNKFAVYIILYPEEVCSNANEKSNFHFTFSDITHLLPKYYHP
jgi:uroporphyrinogen-III decarboxylase